MIDFPEGGITFQPPFKLLNLSGGVSCLFSSNGQCWTLLPPAWESFWGDIAGGRVPEVLDRLNYVKIFSQAYFPSAESLNALLVPTCLHRVGKSGASLDLEQAQRWSGLAVAFRSRDEKERGVRAERIGAQIRFVANTLDAMHRSYRGLLTTQLKRERINRPEEGIFYFTSDQFSLDLGYRTQSCLNELFGLRDFLFDFVFKEMYAKPKYSIADASRILQEDDRFGLASIILPALARDDDVGDVALMSIYRNAIFHYLGPNFGPIGPSYCFREYLEPLGYLPVVVYPLPDDVEQLKLIEKGKGLGIKSIADQKEDMKRFMQLEKHTDALDFCYKCFLKILEISSYIEMSIPQKSEPGKLSEKDIITVEVFNEDGRVRRFKKNEDSKLAEY